MTAAIPHLAPGETLEPAFAPIAVSLVPASASAAAILRLAAAHGGLDVEVEAITTADPKAGRPMTLELTARLAHAAVRLSQADTRVVLDVVADMHTPPSAKIAEAAADLDEGQVARALAAAVSRAVDAGGTHVDVQLIHPADRTGDPYHRPDVDAPAPRLFDEPSSTLADARKVLDRLAANPRLADAVRHLVRPLVELGLALDGNAEAILTRAANDLAGVRRTHLLAMQRRFAEGRHRNFPDRHELMAALGEVVATGLARPTTDPETQS